MKKSETCKSGKDERYRDLHVTVAMYVLVILYVLQKRYVCNNEGSEGGDIDLKAVQTQLAFGEYYTSLQRVSNLCLQGLNASAGLLRFPFSLTTPGLGLS